MDDDFEELEAGDGNYLCPSCGVMPGIQGPSKDCSDPEGCALFSEEIDFDEDYDEEEDDMGVDELDFD